MDGGATEFIEERKVENLEQLWNNTGIALWSLILFGAFLLNFTLLLAFLKRPGLRTISNRFVMNLTVSNLLTCCVLNPLLMLDTPALPVNQSMCSIAEGATAIVTTSSIFSVFLIAIDQYLAVVDPLRYRTRIDTLKCSILVITVWIISLIFGFLAAFNPEPNSLWLICQTTNKSIISTDFNVNSSSFVLNFTQETNDFSFEIEESVRLIENSTQVFEETILEAFRKKATVHVTYGLIYASTYSLFAYLLPFIGVCWIYIRIYSAAHKNSERTRKTGSRPILSSGSFCEEYYPVRQDVSNEDFRRIPKISSLSSIDESTETSPSQLPRRFSEHYKQPSPIQEEPTTVIFTVGSQKVDVTPQSNNLTKEVINKVPISILKAEFFGKKHEEKNNVLVKSKFSDDVPEQKRKSSHDLMYEEMLKKDLEALKLRSESTESDTSDDEDRGNYQHLASLDIEGKNFENKETKFNRFDVRDLNEVGNYSEMHRFNSIEIPGSNASTESLGKSHVTCDTKNEKNIKLKSENSGIFRKSSIDNFEGNGNFSNNTPMVTITPPHKTSLHRIPSTKSTSNYINSLKYRISNGSLFKYREETRAARVSAFVIVMGLICWTPYVVVLMLRNSPIDSFCENFPHETNIMGLSFFILAAYVSPLLFGYRSRRVQRELKKIFCFKKELSYKNNRSLMAKKVLKRRNSGNLGNIEMDNRYNIFNCVYGKNKWPKEKVHFVQVPETALIVETCRSSFSSGASTQISSTSTDEC